MCFWAGFVYPVLGSDTSKQRHANTTRMINTVAKQKEHNNQQMLGKHAWATSWPCINCGLDARIMSHDGLVCMEARHSLRQTPVTATIIVPCRHCTSRACSRTGSASCSLSACHVQCFQAHLQAAHASACAHSAARGHAAWHCQQPPSTHQTWQTLPPASSKTCCTSSGWPCQAGMEQ